MTLVRNSISVLVASFILAVSSQCFAYTNSATVTVPGIEVMRESLGNLTGIFSVNLQVMYSGVTGLGSFLNGIVAGETLFDDTTNRFVFKSSRLVFAESGTASSIFVNLTGDRYTLEVASATVVGRGSVTASISNVPGPTAGAGLPMMIAVLALTFIYRRRGRRLFSEPGCRL